jgi:hypothetical protein
LAHVVFFQLVGHLFVVEFQISYWSCLKAPYTVVLDIFKDNLLILNESVKWVRCLFIEIYQ